jgi:hypothetical protein
MVIVHRRNYPRVTKIEFHTTETWFQAVGIGNAGADLRIEPTKNAEVHEQNRGSKVPRSATKLGTLLDLQWDGISQLPNESPSVLIAVFSRWLQEFEGSTATLTWVPQTPKEEGLDTRCEECEECRVCKTWSLYTSSTG